MPRIASEWVRASSTFEAILIPPALPRLPIRHLRLDHARIADLLGGRDRVIDGRSVLAHGRGHAVLGEELFALVLE